MAIKFNIDCVLDKRYGSSKAKKTSKNHLLLLLGYLQSEKSINTIKEASYALATFQVESAFVASSYESYYLNTSSKYKTNKVNGTYPFTSPSNASPTYVNWAKKKTHYKGGRYPNGVPMFVGRGFLQCTHDYNYKLYSGVVPGLFENPELIFNPVNGWLMAMDYFRRRKTLQKASSGNLTEARESVNGGVNGINEINAAYRLWIQAFEGCNTEENVSASSGVMASNEVWTGVGHGTIGGPKGKANIPSSSYNSQNLTTNKKTNIQQKQGSNLYSVDDTLLSDVADNNYTNKTQLSKEEKHKELYQIVKPNLTKQKPIIT